MRIRHRAATATLFVNLVYVPSALAADAPKELYNKTISLSWREARVQRADAGDVARMNTNSRLTIYVSDSGRVFARISRQNERGRNNTDKSPEGEEQKAGSGAGNLAPSFEGNTLNVVSTMRSGARIVQATFGAGFSACSLRVIFGKESGADLYHRGMDGRMYKIISTDVSGASCQIRAGNAFAGN